MPPDVLDQAIEGIADGRPVDWLALDKEAGTEEEREGLKYLRIVGEIAGVHRAADDPLLAASQASTLSAGEASTVGPEPSEMWGRYRLVEKVGEGSFGSVYVAWDPELERDVAIKILHGHLADSQLRERLLREGRALAKVRHPNVVSVLGVESHEERVGLCMELVRGETLEVVLRRHGMLNAREAAPIGEDVCRALAAVHHAGFVHRDVKARNVMRERAGRIVLMDFGAGRQADHLMAGAVDVVGTPLYMAPEVLAGEAASASSDVYSVGVLLYHLVTAEYPVDGRTLDDLREAHRQGRRRLLSERRPDLPMPFIQVVERALAADPPQRYASAGSLLEALGTFSNDVKPKPSALASHLSRAALAIAAIACGLTGLGYVISRTFNLALERSDFAAETVRDLFVWGFRSSVAPTLVLMLAVLAVALLTVLRRLVIASSPHARRLDANVRHHLDRIAHRLRLGDLTMLASWALLVSASMLVTGWWYFSPLLGAVFTHASTAPAEDLAFLSPGFSAYQDQYRKVFTYISILSVVVWYPVAKLAARTRQPLNWGLLVAGMMIAVLSVVTFDMPYRLFIQANADAARWNGYDCYIIGERSDDLLVFCPTIQPPRNRIVPKDAVERSGTRENIFTKFSPGRTE